MIKKVFIFILLHLVSLQASILKIEYDIASRGFRNTTIKIEHSRLLRDLGIDDFHQLPESLTGLEALKTKFTSAFPSFQKLKKLKITGLWTSFTLRDIFAGLTMLQELALSGNNLTTLGGILPSSLEKLDLADNNLTTLDDSLHRLSQLEKLDLADNNLTTLGISLDGLTRLKTLDLSNNRLTTIDDSLLGLTQLKKLYLKGNNLTTFGYLPKGITDLKLSDNQLLTFPLGIFYLYNLESLSMNNTFPVFETHKTFQTFSESILDSLQDSYAFKKTERFVINQLLRILHDEAPECTEAECEGAECGGAECDLVQNFYIELYNIEKNLVQDWFQEVHFKLPHIATLLTNANFISAMRTTLLYIPEQHRPQLFSHDIKAQLKLVSPTTGLFTDAETLATIIQLLGQYREQTIEDISYFFMDAAGHSLTEAANLIVEFTVVLSLLEQASLLSLETDL